MKKGILVFFTAAALLFSFFAGGKLLSAKQTVSAEPEQASVATVREPDAPVWRVGIYQGRVAVFLPEEEKPLQVLETPVDTLPAPDRAALENGISVCTREELTAILEDYDS